MWIRTLDDCIVDASGKVLHFSVERFVKDICVEGCCFICGARPDQKDFNDEHVFPEWLQRRFGLFDKTIRLPNDTLIRYDRYTVPCCAECNTFMGEVVEREISSVVRNGAEAINKYIQAGGSLRFFVWLGLIFLKVHLRDRSHRVHLDRRKGTETISDAYDWESLHHIHSLCRCFYNDAVIDPKAIGSMLVIPVEPQGGTGEVFDYGDLFWPQTVCLRLGEVGIVAVLDDSSAANSILWSTLEKITGPVNELQLRELMGHYAYVNLQLKDRPQFHTRAYPEHGNIRIEAVRPAELELEELDRAKRGALIHYAVRESLPRLISPGLTSEQLEEAILRGDFTFLFDENGDFVTKGITPIPSP